MMLEKTLRHEAYLARITGNEVASDHLVGLLEDGGQEHIVPATTWGQIVFGVRPHVLRSIVDWTNDAGAASTLKLMLDCEVARAAARAVYEGNVLPDSKCFWTCATHAPLPKERGNAKELLRDLAGELSMHARDLVRKAKLWLTN